MTDTAALTDDQLRQVARHYAIEAAREVAQDHMGIGEMLDSALPALGIDVDVDALSDAPGFGAMCDRIEDLIRSATITVDWPDAPVRAFAAKLRAELETLRASHEQRGLYPAALAYTGAVASIDAALLDLDGESTEGATA